MAYYNWLGKKEELEYTERRFEGKLGAKSWKYSQQIDKLIQIRLVIFIMSILVFYPILMLYLFHGYFSMEMFIERLICSVILLIAGLLFNKYRIVSILLASIPLILILIANVMGSESVSMRAIAFTTAILIFILSGLYFQFQAKKLRKELDKSLLENQLIDDE